MATFRNTSPALNSRYTSANTGNVSQAAGNIAGLNPYTYQGANLDSSQLAFDNPNTANFSDLGINNVNNAGVTQIQDQALQRDFSFDPTANQNIALAEGQLQGAITGQDAASRALQSMQGEQQSARESAQRGLQEQQFAQSGTTDAQQNVLRQQQDRAFAGERQENLATLGQQTLARADSATQQLANLGMQQQQFNQQSQQLEDARGRWESEFGLQAEMSKQDIEKWAAQFNMSVEQAKDMQDQWKSNLITQQTGMQMSTDQFYDSLNLDKDKMKVANEQWKSEFGLQKVMSEADLEQWAAEYGLTVDQARQMEAQWNAEFQLTVDTFNDTVDRMDAATGLEAERYLDEVAQLAISNGWTDAQLAETMRANKAGEALSEDQFKELQAQNAIDSQLNWASLKETQRQHRAGHLLSVKQFNEMKRANLVNEGLSYDKYLVDKEVADKQIEQVTNAINKEKYDSALMTTDFTNEADLTALQDSYRTWTGEDNVPSYSQLKNESWDVKENAAGTDTMAHIVNMGYQASEQSFEDAWNTDSALRGKIEDMVRAQLGKGDNERLGNSTIRSMGKKIYDQMIKSPTQLDRDQARSDYQSTDTYKAALEAGDTEKLDQLFTDLDFLSQTGGLKPVTMPDGTTAVADSGGNIVSSSGDYTNIGTISSGGRYATDTDGITHVSVDGTDRQFRVVDGKYEYRQQVAKSAYRWSTIKEGTSMYDAAEEIYGKTGEAGEVKGEADQNTINRLLSSSYKADDDGSGNYTLGRIKYNPADGALQLQSYVTGEFEDREFGKEYESTYNDDGSPFSSVTIKLNENGIPVRTTRYH